MVLLRLYGQKEDIHCRSRLLPSPENARDSCPFTFQQSEIRYALEFHECAVAYLSV